MPVWWMQKGCSQCLQTRRLRMMLERLIQKRGLTGLQIQRRSPQRQELIVHQKCSELVLADWLQTLGWSLQKKMKTTVHQRLCLSRRREMVSLQKLGLMLRLLQS